MRRASGFRGRSRCQMHAPSLSLPRVEAWWSAALHPDSLGLASRPALVGALILGIRPGRSLRESEPGRRRHCWVLRCCRRSVIRRESQKVLAGQAARKRRARTVRKVIAHQVLAHGNEEAGGRAAHARRRSFRLGHRFSFERASGAQIDRPPVRLCARCMSIDIQPAASLRFERQSCRAALLRTSSAISSRYFLTPADTTARTAPPRITRTMVVRAALRGFVTYSTAWLSARSRLPASRSSAPGCR